VISIITPSYNQGKFIEQTIQSVLKQNISELDYLVVDGGSTDETLNILRRYENRIRWISENDNGQTDAINKGLKLTRGDIIGWINSDDIYYEGALSKIMNFFREHPDIEVLYGDADHIDKDGNLIELYYTEDWNYNRLKEICFICQPTVFFRRRIMEKAGPLDKNLRYCMDYEYWLRLGAITPFVRLRQKLAGSRLYPENKTLGSRVAVHLEINTMIQQKLGYVPKRWIYAYAHAVANNKNYQLNNPFENCWYVISLLKANIKGFSRWKPAISTRDFVTMSGWIVGAVSNLLRNIINWTIHRIILFFLLTGAKIRAGLKMLKFNKKK